MQCVGTGTERRSTRGRHRPVSLANLVMLTVVTLGAACDGRSTLSEASASPIRFSVSNQLIAPVTISVDGVPHVAMLGGGSANVAVPATAKWVSWTSAKPAGPDGVPIPDDIGEVKISVQSLSPALEISNVINDQTYVTASIYNFTPTVVSIGVYDGTSLSCASQLPAAVGGGLGFTQIGYYKLLPATEVRAYRSVSDCSGPYVSWSSAKLRSFKDKSGWVTLTLGGTP
jgi:hypothetical protein